MYVLWVRVRQRIHACMRFYVCVIYTIYYIASRKYASYSANCQLRRFITILDALILFIVQIGEGVASKLVIIRFIIQLCNIFRAFKDNSKEHGHNIGQLVDYTKICGVQRLSVPSIAYKVRVATRRFNSHFYGLYWARRWREGIVSVNNMLNTADIVLTLTGRNLFQILAKSNKIQTTKWNTR